MRAATFGLCAALAAPPALAALSQAQFSWVGNKGYTVEGLLSYDDTLSVVSAQGMFYGDFNNGLEDFTIWIYEPLGTLLYEFEQVVGGTVVYDTLEIAFNTSDLSWVTPVYLETGWWSAGWTSDVGFGMSEVRGSLGAGLGQNGKIIDSGPGFFLEPAQTPPPIPAPAPLALVAAGLLAMGAMQWRARGIKA